MHSIKVLAVVISFALFFSSLSSVFAQTMTSSTQDDSLITGVVDPGAVEVGESLITPQSPLYFLKTLRENIEILFSSSSEAKVLRQLEFAQRRLREVRALVKNRQQDLIPSTLERYHLFISQALEMARGRDDLQVKVSEELSRHLYVLQTVYDGVGNPKAKQAIRAVIIRSEEQNRKIVAQLSVVESQQLIKKIAARQAFACKFLIREATASSLNDVEKEYLKEKVEGCRLEVRTNLKDELQDLRRRQASPSSLQR